MSLLSSSYSNPDRQLISRADWYGSMPEIGLRSPDDTTLRAQIGLYESPKVDRPYVGHPGYSLPQRCLRRFFGLQVMQLSLADAEATQTVISAEGEKIYVFDRTVRIVTISGFLYDTDRDLQDPDSGFTIPGMRGLSEWNDFYEVSRISQIARTGNIVQIRVQDLFLSGAFVSSAKSMNATDPHRVDVVIQLLCKEVRPIRYGRRVLSTIPGTDVRGRLTAEGAESIGLIRSSIIDPRQDQLFVSSLPSSLVTDAPQFVVESADRDSESFEA